MRAKQARKIVDEYRDDEPYIDLNTVLDRVGIISLNGGSSALVPEEIVSPRLIELLLIRGFEIDTRVWCSGVRVSW